MGKSLYQSLKRTLCEIPVEDFMNENLGIVVVHDLSLGHSSLTNLSHRVLSVPRTSLLHNIVKVHLQKSTMYQTSSHQNSLPSFGTRWTT